MAAATAMATVSELAMAKPLRKSMPITNRPSSDTTTVPPANTIARPLVRTAVAIAVVDVAAGGELGAVAGDHEQRVVDADAEPDHRRDRGGEVGGRQHGGDQRDRARATGRCRSAR